MPREYRYIILIILFLHLDSTKQYFNNWSLLGVDQTNVSSSQLTLSYIEKHENSEDGKPLHRCTLCGKTGKDRSNLRRHVESVHFPASFHYNCQYCEKVFNAKNTLNVHISRHHRDQKQFWNVYCMLFLLQNINGCIFTLKHNIISSRSISCFVQRPNGTSSVCDPRPGGEVHLFHLPWVQSRGKGTCEKSCGVQALS